MTPRGRRGVGDLAVAGLAVHDEHLAAGGLDQRRVVGGLGARPRARRRSASAGNACGVCTATKRGRGRRVAAADARAACRSPGRRAPTASAPSPTARRSPGRNSVEAASGRAASCTTTTSASAGTAAKPGRAPSRCGWRRRPRRRRRPARGRRPDRRARRARRRRTPSGRRRATSRGPGGRRASSYCLGSAEPVAAPAATTIAHDAQRCSPHASASSSFARPLLVDVEGEGQLGHEDLAGLGEHPLLAGRQALVLVAERQVPHDLGDLVDVAALQLLDVVLEAARPVGRHPRLLLAKDGEHLLDLFVVDDVAQADGVGVVGRHLEGEVAVGEAEDEVLAFFSPKASIFSRFSITAAPWWG